MSEHRRIDQRRIVPPCNIVNTKHTEYIIQTVPDDPVPIPLGPEVRLPDTTLEPIHISGVYVAEITILSFRRIVCSVTPALLVR